MTGKAGVTYNVQSYLQGMRDAYEGKVPREGVTDSLAYASGRVEGEAARLQGVPLEEVLAKARLPHAVRPRER